MSKKYAILTLLFVSVSKMLNAQTVDVTNKLSQDGKINTVIVVASIILLGIFLFLFFIERRVKKLEQEAKD
ncbi:MAG: CcmD family protein [Chitinophagales bacterium]